MNDITSVNQNSSVHRDAFRRNAAADKAAAVDQQSGKDMPVAAEKEVPQASVEVEQSSQVAEAVAKLNDFVASRQRDLRFSVDESLGRPIVTVIDGATDEVIRQIPSETALHLARNLKDRIGEISIQEVAGESGNLGLINTRI